MPNCKSKGWNKRLNWQKKVRHLKQSLTSQQTLFKLMHHIIKSWLMSNQIFLFSISTCNRLFRLWAPGHLRHIIAVPTLTPITSGHIDFGLIDNPVLHDKILSYAWESIRESIRTVVWHILSVLQHTVRLFLNYYFIPTYWYIKNGNIWKD